MPYAVVNDWYQGETEIASFEPEERSAPNRGHCCSGARTATCSAFTTD
jgi:hypothetical protein